MAGRDDSTQVEEDGLVCPEVGPWAEEKHKLVSLYSALFSTGMKEKWGRRVYVELYAGAGYGRIRKTLRLIAGSPIRALGVNDPFDKYVFCEEASERLSALKVRVARHASRAEVQYVEGDCNDRVFEVLAAIPAGSTSSTVLTLCFADPFDIGLKFEPFASLRLPGSSTS